MASRFMISVALAWAGAPFEVVGSCSSGTSDTSRKPVPHSMKGADCVGSLASLWDVGVDVVSVRPSGVRSCVAPTVSDPCVIF